MARSIFHPDSQLMITMAQITDCIFLSMFWFVGCIPLVTVGASTAALYDAVYHGFRRGDKHGWRRFADSFRQNLKPGLPLSVVFLAIVSVMVWGGIQLWNSAVYGEISWALFAGAAFVMMVMFGIGSILFPMLSRFENSTAAMLANTFRLGMARLPQTAALGLLNTVTAILCVIYVIPLFFLPALAALISTLFIEPMFRPYMSVEEDAA